MLVSRTQNQRIKLQTTTHTYGSELWPEPIFAASTGLTQTQTSVSGGMLLFSGSATPASCNASTPPTFAAAEVYQYSITYENPDGAPLVLTIGGATVNLPFTTGSPRTLTGTVTVPGTPVQKMGVSNPVNNSGTEDVTNLSITKQLT